MGNTPSTLKDGRASSQTSGAVPAGTYSKPTSNDRKPRRRESLTFATTLPTNKTTKPTASFESATAQQFSNTSAAQSYLQRTLTPSSGHDSTPQDATTHSIIMGAQESKQAAHERSQTSPVDIVAPAGKAAPIEGETHYPLSPPPPQLVDESYQLPSAQYSRPPRLPLPIEEELHTPGSPIISPQDITEPVDGLPRRSSVLSSTTVDDDDLGDDLETLEGGPHPPVPTMIEWREGGDKVYVTGTFAGWDRKFRLQRNGPSKHPGAQSALISLQPGTHHVRFIVDNDMKLSNFMPTAVDFTNFLVNYIEVVSTPEPTTTPSEPVDVPPGTKPLPTAAQPRPIEYRAPPGVHPPHVLPPTPELIAVGATGKSAPKSADATPTSKPTLVAPAPAKRYHREVPRFLLDLDAPDDSPNYARANAVLHTAPAAPTLPIFLNKSILNGTTPVKDDASVLNMPNHTMLNHLATSSIKNKVLATSATTRYKSKFLTTIMYKPTSATGE